MKNVKVLIGATILATVFGVFSAKADQLDDIKNRGQLICGTLGTSQPFSFQDNKTRTLVGYDVDFCKLIADKLGVKIDYKLLSATARIPELQEGRVDILAANLGYSKERAEQIDYSNVYYVTPQKLLVRKDSPYETIDSLNGKRIGATKGSSSERDIKKILDKSNVIGYNDSPAAYLALQQGKVEAQFASELVLVRLTLQSPPTAPVRVIEKAVLIEPWGLGIKKGETALLNAVNTILDDAEKDGSAKQLFDKWMGAQSEYKLERTFTISPLPQ